jgi:hypothetical protein
LEQPQLEEQLSLRKSRSSEDAVSAKMDDDSLNFGSPAAAATPNSNSILAQPPLQIEDATGSGQEDRASEGPTGDGKFPSSILSS